MKSTLAAVAALTAVLLAPTAGAGAAVGTSTDWIGPLAPSNLVPNPEHLSQRQREGELLVRFRDETGDPTLSLFSATIPVLCEDGSFDRLEFEYDSRDDTKGVTLSAKPIELEGNEGLRFEFNLKKGDESLSAKGIVLLDGHGEGKYPDAEGRLSYSVESEGQHCRSLGGPATPTSWEGRRT
ncbi:MAG: hypothetical protein ACRDPE_22555 [Solirubrobacterales bacterium]